MPSAVVLLNRQPVRRDGKLLKNQLDFVDVPFFKQSQFRHDGNIPIERTFCIKYWSNLGMFLLLAAIMSQILTTQRLLGGVLEDEEVSESISIIGIEASLATAKANAHAELQALIQQLNEKSETEVAVTIDSEGFVLPYYWTIEATVTYGVTPPPVPPID